MSAGLQTTRVGEMVGSKYRIVRLLAEGGMGVVYEAQHIVVKRRFAIKFLRSDFTDRREILTRFHREAQTAGTLENENIAAAVDFGILTDGTPYIVMELLVGESLGSLLTREGRIPVRRAADLCLQACRGMQAAHASGIVHRDLKPENLFVCRRDDGCDLVKVLDFGIAKLEQIESHNAATRTGTILGTPAYMSPEQARGDKTIDFRSDVYGLAAILFEMLSGLKPHPGDSHNAILHHISTQPAIPLRSIQPDLPGPLLDAVEQALSSDPNRRQPSAEALGEMLAPFARREVWPAPHRDLYAGAGAPGRIHTPDRQQDAFAGSTVAAQPEPRPPGASRRGRTPVVAGAALVVAAALGIAIAMGIASRRHSSIPSLQSSGPPPASAPRLVDRQNVGDGREAGDRGRHGDRPEDNQVSAATPGPAPETSIAPSAPPRKRAGRPPGRSAGRPPEPHDPPASAPVDPTTAPPVREARPARVTFDPKNPYGD